jgi:uncharacterized protein (TIGR02466 family)
MSTVYNLFPTPVYQADFQNYHKIQQDLELMVTSNLGKDLVNKYHAHDHPIKGGALTMIYDCLDKDNSTIFNPALQEVYNFINLHCNEYWKTLNLSKFLKPYILQMWVNGVKNGGFVSSHNHNPVPVSGVFYIKATSEQGNIFMENPLDLVIGKSPYHAEERKPTRFHQELEVSSGRLILFPGWLKHFTAPNTTNEIRLSMAINFGCQGEVRITEFI